MNKRSFTLLELLIATALTTTIILFLYSALDQSTRSNALLVSHVQKNKRDFLVYKLLFLDLIQASEVNVTKTSNKNYSILSLRTNNSLYEIPAPYVLYFVNRKKMLIRLESAYPITLPISLEKENFTFPLLVLKNVQKFRVFSSVQEIPLLHSNKKDKTVSIYSLLHNGYLIFLTTRNKTWILEKKN